MPKMASVISSLTTGSASEKPEPDAGGTEDDDGKARESVCTGVIAVRD
jgi:hypothetical protein